MINFLLHVVVVIITTIVIVMTWFILEAKSNSKKMDSVNENDLLRLWNKD